MGWNGSDSRMDGPSNLTQEVAKSASSTFSTILNYKTLGFCLAIGLVGGLAGWFYFGQDDVPRVAEGKKPRSTSKIAGSKPKIATNAPNTAAIVKATRGEKDPMGQLTRSFTNKTGSVIEDYILPNGQIRRVVKRPPPIWDNAADQMIAMAVSITAGSEAAPLPSGVSNDEFRRALKKSIIIKNDDPEKIKELKRKVREARNEILEEMERSGRSFEEIIRDHHEEMNANTKLYQDALRGLVEVKRNGSPEDVRKYKIMMNAALQQVGAKELPFDDKDQY